MTSETEKRNKMSQFQKDVIAFLRLQYGKALAEADATEIYHSVSAAAMCQARKNWGRLEEGKKVCYFSAEFLVQQKELIELLPTIWGCLPPLLMG